MNEEKKGLLSRIIDEYKKVTWADARTVFQVTVIVLLITIFVAVMVLVFDIAFGNLLRNVSALVKRVLYGS